MKKYLFALLIICCSQQLLSQNTEVKASETAIEQSETHVYPEYPGGMKKFYAFIGANFNVPDGVKPGKIIMQFIVQKDGRLSKFKVVKNTGNKKIRDEAIRVLKLSPKWTPGEKDGKKVRVKYVLPILFSN